VLPFYPCLSAERPLGLAQHFVAVYPGRLFKGEAGALMDSLEAEARRLQT
jgi:hypothetical protein